MSSSSSAAAKPQRCAACTHRKAKCEPRCIFAPHFPPGHGVQYASVHDAYGASNLSKLLAELRPEDRADAVATLVYEAQAIEKDPVYGCVARIAVLQQKLDESQVLLAAARQELAGYVAAAEAAAAAAFQPFGAGSVLSLANQAGAMRLGGGPEASKAGVVIGTGSGVHAGHPHPQPNEQMARVRVENLLALQKQAEEEIVRQQEVMMWQALAAARERDYPHHAQAGQLYQPAMGLGAAPGQMALQAQQLAAAADEEIAREQQAAAMGLDVTLLGHGQQTVQRFSVPTVNVAREQDVNLMEQAAAFARAMSGNMTNMAAFQPGGSADAGTFLVQQQPQQPQPVNAPGFQTGASLLPPLADLPGQQQGDDGDDDQFSSDDLAAYFSIPGPSRPPDDGGSS